MQYTQLNGSVFDNILRVADDITDTLTGGDTTATPQVAQAPVIVKPDMTPLYIGVGAGALLLVILLTRK